MLLGAYKWSQLTNVYKLRTIESAINFCKWYGISGKEIGFYKKFKWNTAKVNDRSFLKDVKAKLDDLLTVFLRDIQRKK